MDGSPSVSAQTLRSLLAASTALGADGAAIAQRMGLGDELLADPDARLPLKVAIDVIVAAERESGDPDFGLHLAELAAFVPHDALYHAARACVDLRHVFHVATRYFRLVSSLAEPELLEEGDTARFIHRVRGIDQPPRAAVECALAMLVMRPRAKLGTLFRVREVRFRHAAPASTAEHARIFDAPVSFERAENEVVFDRAMLDLPHDAGDPRLHAVLQRYVDELLARLPAVDTFAGSVRRVIADSISSGEPAIEDVAARLHVSARSLQRRLSEEGTSFSTVVKEVRRGLAASYLREGKLPLAEVAFLLGFSEVSSFHRAFKSWYGATPQEFRKGAVTPGAR